jgi:hypothetical protein
MLIKTLHTACSSCTQIQSFNFDTAKYEALTVKINWSNNPLVNTRKAYPENPVLQLRHGFTYLPLELKSNIKQNQNITEIQILSFPENLTTVACLVRARLNCHTLDKVSFQFHFRVDRHSWPK